MSIVYAREQALDVADYVAVVGSTYMRDRRPLTNPARLRRMLDGADMVLTARLADGGIVGLLRGISDGEWVCYVADLVVHEAHQRRGIGTGLLAECQRLLGTGMSLVLIAYPEAQDYYRRIGMSEIAAFYTERLVRS